MKELFFIFITPILLVVMIPTAPLGWWWCMKDDIEDRDYPNIIFMLVALTMLPIFSLLPSFLVIEYIDEWWDE